jgi:hypothetical protein
MRKFLLIILSLSFVLTSCSDVIETYETATNIPQETEIVTVSNEGYLTFPSFKSLEMFFEKVQNGGTTSNYDFSRSDYRFESVAMLENRIATDKKSRAIGYSSISNDDINDLEEMTQDEYNLMKSENLLFDDLMTHAMDTTLRICIEGELYKITENGTFSVKLEKAEKLDLAIKEFNPSLKDALEAGATVQLNSDVKFTNTFKNVQIDNSELLEFDPEEIPISRANSSTAQNEFHKSYGVESYKWKNSNIIKKFLDLIRGKDVSKTRNFSKKYRVQVNIFDVNYLFYKSAGIKVKMQQRKKFCFVPYWVNIEADKLAIGFNEMDGILTYNNPNNMSSISPTEGAKWGKFTGTLNGIASTYMYGAYHNLKFIKDWTDVIFGWMPELKIGEKNYTDQVINKLYNTPAKLVYQHTKKLINKTVYTPIEKKIKPTDPMLAYLIWGTSSTHFNKEHPYIMGVKEYSSRKSKSVIFDRSFGIAFYVTIPVPYTPSDIDINKIDAFGAAFYDNKWLGVRFYWE